MWLKVVKWRLAQFWCYSLSFNRGYWQIFGRYYWSVFQNIEIILLLCFQSNFLILPRVKFCIQVHSIAISSGSPFISSELQATQNGNTSKSEYLPIPYFHLSFRFFESVVRSSHHDEVWKLREKNGNYCITHVWFALERNL